MAPASEEPDDWADDLATRIIEEARQHGLEARELIAARLRVVKCDGIGEGIRRISAALKASSTS